VFRSRQTATEERIDVYLQNNTFCSLDSLCGFEKLHREKIHTHTVETFSGATRCYDFSDTEQVPLSSEYRRDRVKIYSINLEACITAVIIPLLIQVEIAKSGHSFNKLIIQRSVFFLVTR